MSLSSNHFNKANNFCVIKVDN